MLDENYEAALAEAAGQGEWPKFYDLLAAWKAEALRSSKPQVAAGKAGERKKPALVHLPPPHVTRSILHYTKVRGGRWLLREVVPNLSPAHTPEPPHAGQRAEATAGRRSILHTSPQQPGGGRTAQEANECAQPVEVNTLTPAPAAAAEGPSHDIPGSWRRLRRELLATVQGLNASGRLPKDPPPQPRSGGGQPITELLRAPFSSSSSIPGDHRQPSSSDLSDAFCPAGEGVSPDGQTPPRWGHLPPDQYFALRVFGSTRAQYAGGANGWKAECAARIVEAHRSARAKTYSPCALTEIRTWLQRLQALRIVPSGAVKCATHRDNGHAKGRVRRCCLHAGLHDVLTRFEERLTAGAFFGFWRDPLGISFKVYDLTEQLDDSWLACVAAEAAGRAEVRSQFIKGKLAADAGSAKTPYYHAVVAPRLQEGDSPGEAAARRALEWAEARLRDECRRQFLAHRSATAFLAAPAKAAVEGISALFLYSSSPETHAALSRALASLRGYPVSLDGPARTAVGKLSGLLHALWNTVEILPFSLLPAYRFDTLSASPACPPRAAAAAAAATPPRLHWQVPAAVTSNLSLVRQFMQASGALYVFPPEFICCKDIAFATADPAQGEGVLYPLCGDFEVAAAGSSASAAGQLMGARKVFVLRPAREEAEVVSQDSFAESSVLEDDGDDVGDELTSEETESDGETQQQKGGTDHRNPAEDALREHLHLAVAPCLPFYSESTAFVSETTAAPPTCLTTDRLEKSKSLRRLVRETSEDGSAQPRVHCPRGRVVEESLSSCVRGALQSGGPPLVVCARSSVVVLQLCEDLRLNERAPHVVNVETAHAADYQSVARHAAATLDSAARSVSSALLIDCLHLSRHTLLRLSAYAAKHLRGNRADHRAVDLQQTRRAVLDASCVPTLSGHLCRGDFALRSLQLMQGTARSVIRLRQARERERAAQLLHAAVSATGAAEQTEDVASTESDTERHDDDTDESEADSSDERAAAAAHRRLRVEGRFELLGGELEARSALMEAELSGRGGIRRRRLTEGNPALFACLFSGCEAKRVDLFLHGTTRSRAEAETGGLEGVDEERNERERRVEALRLRADRVLSGMAQGAPGADAAGEEGPLVVMLHLPALETRRMKAARTESPFVELLFAATAQKTAIETFQAFQLCRLVVLSDLYPHCPLFGLTQVDKPLHALSRKAASQPTAHPLHLLEFWGLPARGNCVLIVPPELLRTCTAVDLAGDGCQLIACSREPALDPFHCRPAVQEGSGRAGGGSERGRHGSFSECEEALRGFVTLHASIGLFPEGWGLEDVLALCTRFALAGFAAATRRDAAGALLDWSMSRCVHASQLSSLAAEEQSIRNATARAACNTIDEATRLFSHFRQCPHSSFLFSEEYWLRRHAEETEAARRAHILLPLTCLRVLPTAPFHKPDAAAAAQPPFYADSTLQAFLVARGLVLLSSGERARFLWAADPFRDRRVCGFVESCAGEPGRAAPAKAFFFGRDSGRAPCGARPAWMASLVKAAREGDDKSLAAMAWLGLDAALLGQCAIVHAVVNGHSECVGTLLEMGGSIRESDAKGVTVLHVACRVGRVECVRLLVSLGADVNAMDAQGRSPLHYAMRRGHRPCVEELVNGGANPQVVDKWGARPCDVACFDLLEAPEPSRLYPAPPAALSPTTRCPVPWIDSKP
ncbi:Ankyrin repeat [Diplonema papillatum]|nr:Ankyrin repeat [Diplonema papillatum]